MKTISIHDAKTNLSKYIVAAKQGKAVYIGGFGKAEVVLTALPKKTRPAKRDFSIAKGKLTAAPDAFSKATDEAIAKLLYGEG